MALQVTPDWNKSWTAQKFTQELGIQFNGPGIYATKGETLIVVPEVEDHSWKQRWPEYTRFRVSMYGVPFQETIFSQIAIAPSRLMEN